ncbi:MAG: GIY-YIG nuclease family protein [Planctomycetota bacterium]|jgi:predicted GIY-YIG superfamily endonuclease
MWHVYILVCSDGNYYTGYAEHLLSRVERHNEGRGAKYTSCRRPVKLVWQESHGTEESATKREKQIKRWTKAKKRALIEGDIETLRALAKCRTSSGRAFSKMRL